MLPEDLPDGMEGLPKFSAEDVAEATKRTKDKWTNAAGVTDVSQMGGQVNQVNIPENPALAQEEFRQKALEGVRDIPPAPSKPTPPPREREPYSKDGEKIVPTDMYLDAKKEWKAEQEKLYARLDEADKKIMNLNEFIMAQEARQQPLPQEQAPPEEEDISFDPILDEDGNEDPRFRKLMDQIDRRDRVIYGKVTRQQQHEMNAVKSAAAKQAVNSMLDGFFRETGIDPKSETGKFSKEGIVSLITALPANMKERAASIWFDRMNKVRSEILTQDARESKQKKEEVKTRHGTETPAGAGAGEIPAEYLDRRIPAKIRAERWLKHQEALRKAGR